MILRFACVTLFAVLVGSAAAGEGDWPQWRGPQANGVAPAGDPPLTWGEGKNVRWKIKIPGRGTSTPIVWDDSIFIQTAVPMGQKADGAAPAAAAEPTRDRGNRDGGGRGGFGASPPPTEPYKFVLMCIDRKTGKLKWEKVAREVVPHEGHHRDHGFASYSPITDGKHVYAYFGSRGLHCYDMEGNLKWQKDLGKMQTRNGFGEGSSPALFGDTIVVVWDHEASDDFIAAFDKNTGEERWRTPRDEPTNWATPLVVEHDGKPQVIVNATNSIRSYDLKTGEQVWEGPPLTTNTIPSPVTADGIVYCMSGFRGAALYAIRLGRSGNVSNTDAIVWSAKKSTPYVPSPLLYGDRLYFYSGNNAILSCFDVRTGKAVVDSQRLDDLEGVYASPVGAAGRVYLVGRNGATLVIKHLDKSDAIEVLATNQLDDRIDASPAIVGKELFLRGHEHLYCIAQE